MIEDGSPSLHASLDTLLAAEKCGGFIASKSIIMDDLPSFCYNASRPVILDTLMMEICTAALRSQRDLPWKDHVNKSYHTTIRGSKPSFFNNKDVLHVPMTRFCFDLGGIVFI